METQSSPIDPEIDPASQLSELASIQDSVETEAWLPATPLWHAPLLALMVVGAAATRYVSARWALLLWALVFGSLAIMIWDARRRRTAKPRRLRKPWRLFAFHLFVLLVAWPVAVGVEALLKANSDGGLGSAAAATSAIGGWVLATLVLTVGIALSNRVRNEWASGA